MKHSFLFFICVMVKLVRLDNLDNKVEAECINNCPLQNHTEKNHYGYSCNYNCNINQCVKGCKLWRQALKQTCQETCNGTSDRLSPKELYCVMGCNNAITKYFSHLRAMLGLPPAPALLADSLNATFLKLEWNFPQAAEVGLSSHVQWKYEELFPSVNSWQYCQNAVWDKDSNVFYVDGLEPYTKYRFRIAMILTDSGHHSTTEPIFSSESVIISTLPFGLPASPPQNVRATPVDATSITISWEPGLFPHGPILSYVLNITDNQQSEVKDIPPENSFIMIRDVKPSQNYTIEIRMRNKRGSGPPAKVHVTTPAEPQTKEIDQLSLILGTEHNIFELTRILGEPNNIYSSRKKMKGMGFHVNKKLIFVIDSEGYVSGISMERNSRTKYEILRPDNLDFIPLDVTVDWLNNYLYILGEMKFQISRYIIKRCDLNGKGLTVAYADLSKKPSCMQIDPINGYLFWSIQDYNKGGLYCMDVSDISNGIRHEVKIKRILYESELGAFTFEHQNFNILISFQNNNTIMSTTIDGKELKNIRPSVLSPQFEKVTSLATANKKFFWTDGHDVFNEEYDEGSHLYFHNTIPHVSNSRYNKVFVNSQSSQPWPIPVNPPTNLEAIFGREIAKTRWQPPHLLGFQGKGAWQNWSYEIILKEVGTENTFSYKDINGTFFTITNLKENTQYVLQVAAYTNSGKSPFSSEFRGSTLNASKNPIILWSAEEGLLRSNAAGEMIETLIHQSEMHGVHYIDIAWFNNQIYLVANDSNVYWYNTTTREKGRIEHIHSVGNIAVDWIGAKLYWSNPKQQLIFRSNLEGMDQEPLLLSVLAKELRIDSIKAYLYWSTGYKVECARLNGFDKFEYHDVQYFSGKQIMGLTLDVEEKLVYWIVRGSEGSKLYKASMRGYKDEPIDVQLVSALQKSNIQGPLCYFHKRLLWLQDDENAAISDLTGKNIAKINGKHMKGLNIIHVVDSSLYMLPDGVDPWTDLNVIPEQVNGSLVKVLGTSESFNVTWEPVTNVNYGKIFYEVLVDSSPPIITTECSIKFPEHIEPFTIFSVNIRSFTYWGTSRQTSIQIHSPPSTPSAPLNLRTFVDYEDDLITNGELVSLIVRWDPPEKPNGIIQGYDIRCWFNNNDTESNICDGVINEANQTEYRLINMDKLKTYYFQVQAFTEIGSSKPSVVVSVNAGGGSPVPRILVSSNDSVFIYDVDINSTKTLMKDIVSPVRISYFMKERWLIWVNQKYEMIQFDISKSSQIKLTSLNGKPLSLTVDWLERSLYYVEYSNRSTIFKIDLNYVSEEIPKFKIFETPNKVVNLEISPFSKSLYWFEVERNNSILMKIQVDGSKEAPFFERNHSTQGYNKMCNCSSLEIEPFFALDHSLNPFKPSMVFVEKKTNTLYSTDSSGCICSIITKNIQMGRGNQLKNLKADLGMVYWTTQSQLNAFGRRNNKTLSAELKLSDMLLYGQHAQPYPPKKCIFPKQMDNYTVSLLGISSTSLKLQMPQTAIYEDCANISMPTVKYTLYFSKYDENFNCIKKNSCETVTTYLKTKEIIGLKPFTKYMISVAVSNYYSERRGVVIGPPVILQTAPGAPSKPLNISALNLNPTLIHVSWLPPEELNGNIIYYEVHWQTDSIVSALRQRGELSVTNSETLSANLRQLSPNETYIIWVRVYSETNNTWTESDRVRITTYPEPDSINLLRKTAYTMKLSWKVTPYVENYTIEYAPIASPIWNTANIIPTKNNSVQVVVDDLKPKRHYKFRLVLLYKDNTDWYMWPFDTRFTYETNGDVPSPPGIPIIQYVKSNVYKVYWEASEDNGAPIEEYKLEGKVVRFYRLKRSTTNRTAPFYLTSPSVDLEDEPDWEVFYNGTDTSWIIDGLDQQLKYVFRISARNAYGWSNTSEESNEFDLNEAARIAEKQNPMKLVLIATGVPISLCIFVVIVLSYVICSGKDKQKKLQPVVHLPRLPDVELATLRELPRRGVHNTNVLYISAKPVPEELTLLPQIKRDQITLNKFLGSGAFGEVFEGKAKGIQEDSEMKVAIKTLKKGTTEQEKTEFLQEAQLMSHFKHEHILQLLGVCLDNDPPFIIMELMEGGDLLNYLRNSRNISDNTPSLTLIELLKMCVDVAKGCKYLEQMHFVHRDLACRNCLVSSYDKELRIVKIGDFGLARDIYKNDYYRKEGEGLLPVRWMAPESLVDGVFTSQSDAWAFGVLLWEIMTLGQQPYPARANLEVLHYVRRGGRLGKPIDCPDDLYDLMLKCWEFEPEKRPTFKYCLDVLDELHRRTLRNPTTAAHEGQYISTVIELFEGISNATYFREQNHPKPGNSWKTEVEDDLNKEKTPFLPTESHPGSPVTKEIPKYIEVIYEPSPPKENDGYEVPKTIVQKTVCD